MTHEAIHQDVKLGRRVHAVVRSFLFVFAALMIVGSAEIASAFQPPPYDPTTLRFANIPQVTPDVFVTMTTSSTMPRKNRPVTYTITITSAGLGYFHARGFGMTGTDFFVYMHAAFYGTPIAVTVLTPPPAPDPMTDFRCLTQSQPGVFEVQCGFYDRFFGFQAFLVPAGTSVQIQVTANTPNAVGPLTNAAYIDPSGPYPDVSTEDKTNNHAFVDIWPQ